MSSNVKFKRITFKSNDLSLTFFCIPDLSLTFFCIPDVSLLITGILSILKPDVMATKRYSFQDDEKTIIDFLKNLKFQNWLNVFVGEKWRIISCLTKLLTDEIF